ncbi:hypothetical protein BVC80_8801g36 [Macleaya cordata]|uniref:Disease resistance N-terminal domain-containing protein n=1 Tax=Macleaya cordata TaxID=56857 RepID=A0A200QEH5_MACCD|nr:hypothetical protein BVC80_8801g36 [Macleaya cordata]
MDVVVQGFVGYSVSEILKNLVLYIAEKFNLAWGLKDEVKKLKDSFEMILAVVEDAETKQVKEKAARVWLERLKDVACDAYAVLIEFSSSEAMHRQESNRKRDKARDLVSLSSFKMASKIKDINQKLEDITKDKVRFQLQPTSSSGNGAYDQLIMNAPSNSSSTTYVQVIQPMLINNYIIMPHQQDELLYHHQHVDELPPHFQWLPPPT